MNDIKDVEKVYNRSFGAISWEKKKILSKIKKPVFVFAS